MKLNRIVQQVIKEMKMASAPDPTFYSPPNESGVAVSMWVLENDQDAFLVRKALKLKGARIEGKSKGDEIPYEYEEWITTTPDGGVKERFSILIGDLPKVELVNWPGKIGFLTGKQRERARNKLSQVIFPSEVRWIPNNQLKYQ